MKIHIPDNKILKKINLEQHGAVKLFDFQIPNDFPNDFPTRSIWEVVDKDKFEAARKVNEKEFLFFLTNEEMVKGFEKYKI
jgi:hypothetical protein